MSGVSEVLPEGGADKSPLARVADDATRHSATTDPSDKKKWGQYFTGVGVAEFMGRLLGRAGSGDGPVRVLDPGAGAGILGIAAALRLLDLDSRPVHLVAVEAELGVLARLRHNLHQFASTCRGRLTFEVVDADFLAMAQPTIGVPTLTPFDCVIANPPYFKMSPTDGRGGTAPNIYARFMEIGARLLRPKGQLVYIVPRSFASGLYFKRFRKSFHASMSLEQVHVFDSRRDAFKDEGVLQENIIVKYRKQAAGPASVRVTSSCGAHDLDNPRDLQVPTSLLLHPRDPLAILHLPACEDDVRVLRDCGAWPSNLRDYGLEISTGPVVPFRAAGELVRSPEGSDVAPLLWMQHVRAEGVVWPIGDGFRKQEHIRLSAPSKLLVPNRTYILLRRFSAKEEQRRLTAAVLRRGALPGDVIGLENHVNFIHRPGGHIDEDEATGLAALLNSSLLDRYFRIVNGNTQVNATEIRAMPLPPRDLTLEIGRRLAVEPLQPVDHVVEEVLGVEGRRGEADPGGAGHACPAEERECGVYAAGDGGCGTRHALE